MDIANIMTNTASYSCRRCGYETPYKHHLMRHLNGKRSCSCIFEDISIDDLKKELTKSYNDDASTCKYCRKQFNYKSSLSRHYKTCKTKQHSMIEEMKEQLRNEIIIELKKGTSSNIHANIVNNTQNIQNNITINLKTFGEENVSHIESDTSFLTTCLLQRDIKSLIESIHCDREHPENHNVRVKSIKQDLMETYVDGNWIISDKEETLDELINKGYRVLRFHSHRNRADIINECDKDEDEFENIMEWLESIYEDNKIRKPIKRQLLILFMNNKALLLGKDIISEMEGQ